MSTRERIAVALRSAGVAGQAMPPDVVLAGIGWPQWVSASPDAYGGLRSSWHVMVTLPNPDRISSIDAADPLIQAVWSQLLDVGEVGICEPVTVNVADPAATDQGVPALRFTLSTSGDRQ